MTEPTTNNYEQKYKLFVVKLQEARKEASLTQIEVSRMLGRTQSYISKCERGELRVDIIQLLEFANLYSKSITYFVENIE